MLKRFHGFRRLLLISCLLCGCATTTPISKKLAKNISIATYNVENLFDTLQDPGREDYTFLPLSFKKGNAEHKAACEKMTSAFYKDECLTEDWNEEKLALKMKRIANTVLSINGEGPDILLLQEVENLRVLNILNDDYLSAAGYKTVVLLEGDDVRGIDVGLLSRLPLAGKPILHRIPFAPDSSKADWKAPLTRGILEVPLKLPNGDRMVTMTFHFPSQGAPVQQRQDAVQFLNSLMAQKNPDTVVVAGGDSNISSSEEAIHHLQSDVLGAQWKVGHMEGCKGCLGTEVYRDVWSFFDILLFSPSLGVQGTAPYQLAPDSIRVVKEGKYQLRMDGTPSRFDDKSGLGVSDHLPMYGEIAPR
jgi:endonuclease/exonuclease/phosphatase family metal-dependent hydrolase